MVKTGKNFLNKGIIKLLILDALYDKEAHGYEIIKKISSKFHGIYEPSPGIIYPTLEYLADKELVTEKIVNGKKVYFITEKGKKVRDDGLQVLQNFLSKKTKPNDRIKVMELAINLKNLVSDKIYDLNEDKLKLLYDILEDAYKKIKEVH